jgi:hypothetical protein
MIKPYVSYPLLAIGALLSATGCASSPPPAAASAPSAAAPAPDDGLSSLTDEQLARKLLDVTGAGKLGEQMRDSMLEAFRKMPDLPPGFIDRFKVNMDMEEAKNIAVRIYLKHMGRNEFIAAIRFYQSDEGRKIVAALPVVTAETMEECKVWGAGIAKKTLKDLGVKAP